MASQSGPELVPRSLTRREIDDILTNLPDVPDQYTTLSTATKALIERELRRVKIPAIYIDELRRVVTSQYVEIINEGQTPIEPFRLDLTARNLKESEINDIINALATLNPDPSVLEDIKRELEEMQILPLALNELLRILYTDLAAVPERYTVQINPRNLTEEEITDIVDSIPEVRGADAKATESVRASIMKKMREQLADIKITPLAIPELKGEIIRQFENARVTPGDVVGVLAAEALGQPITQMALNSFHTSGASKAITSGVDRIKELVNVTSNPKNRSCSIYFKDAFSFDDIVLRKKSELVGVTIGQLLIKDDQSSYEVDTPSAIIGTEAPWWYGLFNDIVRSDLSSAESQFIMRLRFDVNALVSYRVTLEQIAETIENGDKIKPAVICVYSPMSEGIIDVYPIEKTLRSFLKSSEGITTENASLIFLQNIVISNLDKLYIKGISGITGLYPIRSPVLQIVRDEIVNDRENGSWLLQLDKVRMMVTGITRAHLVRLCELTGVTVLPLPPEYEQDYVFVQVRPDETPRDKIKKAIEADKEAERAFETDLKKRQQGNKDRPFIRRPETEIMRAADIIYADTDGSNLKTLLSRDEIDSMHTVSNDVNEIVDALGIEAGRNFLISEFTRVIGMEGSYINPRHINLLVEFMTNQGRLAPITYAGLQRQPTGALAKMSFERPMDIAREAAGAGRIESSTAVSTSVYTGQIAHIGTGYFDAIEDTAKVEARRKELESTTAKADVTEFRDAISQLESLNFGVGELVPENAELEMMFGTSAPNYQTGPFKNEVGVSVSRNPLPTPPVNPVLTAPAGAVSGRLKTVANELTRAPCVASQGPIEIDIRPVPGLSTVPLPGQLATPPVAENTSINMAIPLVNNTLGLPPALLSALNEAETMSLPPAQTYAPLPPPPTMSLPPPPTMTPKATLPKATLPKATLPKATLPKATLPKATLPKATLPKATRRELVSAPVVAPNLGEFMEQ